MQTYSGIEQLDIFTYKIQLQGFMFEQFDQAQNVN